MNGVRIVEARIGHACLMGKRADPATMRVMGRDGRRHLADLYRSSSWSRALMIDGRCVGIGGVRGCAMCPTGTVWLVLADEARRHPRLLLSEGRRYVAELLSRYGMLATNIIDGDEPARRFAARLGFWIDPQLMEASGVRYHVAYIGGDN